MVQFLEDYQDLFHMFLFVKYLKSLLLDDINLLLLKDISFHINAGDYTAVVGPNGGGKTTLINTILGLKKGWTGEIKLFNQKLEDFKEWQKIGYVPQRVIEFDQKFPITVFETVKLGRMYNFKKFLRNHTKDIKTINDIIEALGISDLKNKLIGELSGGQKQRVMIARALASEPE